MKILRALFGSKQLDGIDNILDSHIVESEPRNFGEKSNWTVVKTNNIKEFLTSLNAAEIKKVNWIEACERKNASFVFVCGPIESWILVKGFNQPQADEWQGMKAVHEYLNSLSQKYGEAHNYCSMRTSSVAMWAKSLYGEIARSCCHADTEFYQTGLLTEIEHEIGIDPRNPMQEFDENHWANYNVPGIDEVLRVANNWSFSPMKLSEMDGVPKFGYLVKPEKGVLKLK